MIKNFKYAAMIIIIPAAILSPDGGGVGMVAMGGPVIVLYILSIGLAWTFGKKEALPGLSARPTSRADSAAPGSARP